MQKNNPKYFLAANSCRGFVSEFESNCDQNFSTYIIKGGPGTGKSSFMKRVAEKSNETAILCPCSSDPESLDAVIFEKSKRFVVHRVVNIEIVDGVTRYYTKGDANEDLDAGYITDADIVGITDFKIPYIGMPTLWLNDMFS